MKNVGHTYDGMPIYGMAWQVGMWWTNGEWKILTAQVLPTLPDKIKHTHTQTAYKLSQTDTNDWCQLTCQDLPADDEAI